MVGVVDFSKSNVPKPSMLKGGGIVLPYSRRLPVPLSIPNIGYLKDLGITSFFAWGGQLQARAVSNIAVPQ